MRKFWGLTAVCLLGIVLNTQALDSFPPPDALPKSAEMPDPLVFFDGKKVATRRDWHTKRKPELQQLFQHYMYGYFPKSTGIRSKVEDVDTNFFGGKATRKLVSIWFGPEGKPDAVKIDLLLVIPNKRSVPAPAFLGINFCGNHALLHDPKIPLPRGWMPKSCPGCEENKATDAGRGTQFETWALDQSIERGYAVANFYVGDVDPDKPGFTDGVHPFYFKPGQKAPNPTDWGTIAAWAYGIHRAIDYLVTDKDLDKDRIAVVGHSRNGKTALLAAAFDDRIAMAIPAQAGCGGTAPSRGKIGETVKQINDRFPHWFNDVFTNFNDHVDQIPFDQNCLMALMAPRPLLLPNAVEDTWANWAGQFEAAKSADKVYKFLGVDGLGSDKIPPHGELLNSRLGYFIREGKHSMTRADWKVYLDFADKWLVKNKPENNRRSSR